MPVVHRDTSTPAHRAVTAAVRRAHAHPPGCEVFPHLVFLRVTDIRGLETFHLLDPADDPPAQCIVEELRSDFRVVDVAVAHVDERDVLATVNQEAEV